MAQLCAYAWLVTNREGPWAAGFFDADGSTYISVRRRRRTLRLIAAVTQASTSGPPQVLLRFRAAVGGIGYVRLARSGVYVWQVETAAGVIAAVGAIWPWLGEVKRRQFLGALRRYVAYCRLRQARLRSPLAMRSMASFLAARAEMPLHERPAATHASEIAWAAGFFDGEGTVSLKRKVWKDTHYESICAGVPQGGRATPPSVLLRFRAAVGFGRIYGPGRWRNARLSSWDWHATRYDEVRLLFELLGPLLGEVKTAQANRALVKYGSRPHRVLGPD